MSELLKPYHITFCIPLTGREIIKSKRCLTILRNFITLILCTCICISLDFYLLNYLNICVPYVYLYFSFLVKTSSLPVSTYLFSRVIGIVIQRKLKALTIREKFAVINAVKMTWTIASTTRYKTNDNFCMKKFTFVSARWRSHAHRRGSPLQHYRPMCLREGTRLNVLT